MAQTDIFYNFTSNPLMRLYFFYNGALILKTLLMSSYTGTCRIRYNIFANSEDIRNKNAKLTTSDERIERIRRAHLNDLENIIPFLLISFGWLFTNPSYTSALYLFRTYTICRYLHTLVYAIVVLPQPSRALCFFIAYLITIYMSISTLLHFW